MDNRIIKLKKKAILSTKPQNLTKKSHIALPNIEPQPDNNIKIIDMIKPTIFNKKKKIITSKPLIYIESDTGKYRHFTPAAQE